MTASLSTLRASLLRECVFDRVARSARASRAFVTVRRQGAAVERPAAGVERRTLYQATGSVRRAGEPQCVQLIELAPGAHCGGWPADGLQREWLLMRGQARLGALALQVRDYHRAPAGRACGALASDSGALLYLREAPGLPGPTACTQRDAGAPWDDFAPGIKRRVLWVQAGEAAMLYQALPGAAVPRHAHGHDEECLMLEGELFLDDVLLQSGDYQIAPAGSMHGGVSTDTGAVLFAHGDLNLEVLPG